MTQRRSWWRTLVLAAAATAGPAAAQRLPYAPLLPDDRVVVHGAREQRLVPRIAYPALPLDRRMSPGDFLLDGDEEVLASPAEEQRALDALALSQLSQNYRPRPALWRIRDRDTRIYLFGTIHVLPPGFRWRSAALELAVAASRTLIVEAVNDDTPAALAATGATPLAVRVSPGHRAALAHFVATLPPEAATEFDAMPTWMAAIAIGYTRDVQAGEMPGPGADDWLEARFHAAGRPVVPIEDGAQVLARVDAVAEAEQRRMLDAALDAPQRPRAELRAPLHAWARGEVGRGSALRIELNTSSGADALNGPLLRERNRAWATTLAARLRTPGTALFAAGIAHFVGPDSVLTLLRRRGFRVARID